MKNWRTTLIGAVTAAIVAVYPIIQTGEISWKNVLEAAVIAAFGAVAKDANVTSVGKYARSKKEVGG